MRTATWACVLGLACTGCVPAATSSAGADGPGAAASELPPTRLIARGTEPFWAVEVERGRLVWKTPEQPEGVAIAAERRIEGNGVRYVANGGGASELTITPGRCSDGMSDLVYPFTATWTHGGRSWRGCALPRD